jgi:hypothetical protein
MQILVIQLADNSTFRYQRADDDYANVDPKDVLAKHTAITGEALADPIDSALIDADQLVGATAADLGVAKGEVRLDRLAVAKREACAVVDADTRRRIANGFVFQGLIFSLSEAAQRSLLGFWALKSSAVYPLSWPTRSNESSVELKDEAMFTEFYSAAFDAVRSARDEGSGRKKEVMAGKSEIRLAFLE